MQRIDVYFMVLAGLMLLSGVMLGIHMAMSHDHSLMPVHAHTNLVGWASLALFGLTYRAWPELKNGFLARAHFASAAAAAIVMPFGIYRALTAQDEAIATVSALIWALAVLLFLVQLVRLARAAVD